jgi:hypothetical protein
MVGAAVRALFVSTFANVSYPKEELELTNFEQVFFDYHVFLDIDMYQWLTKKIL